MSSELGVAVWGLGRHATRRVLPALVQSRAVRIAGICTRNKERGRAEARRHACEYFASPEHMLAAASVDVVIVATPTGLHYAHGRRVLEAGKHLWCEKPMTHSYVTTRQLFDLAERTGRAAVSALMYKYHPQFSAIESALAKGAIGELKALTIRFGMPDLGVTTFRDDPDLAGGALLDVGCYGLSVAYRLLSTPPKLQAARIWMTAPSRVDTEGWAVLQSGNVVVQSAWGMARAYQNNLHIWGARGALVAERIFTKEDDYASTILVYDERGGGPAVIDTGKANGYGAMLESLAANLESTDFLAAERKETEWCAQIMEQIAQG